MPALAPFRACSTLFVRSVDINRGIIEGVASSARTDIAGDVLEPKGAVYQLPMPLLMQHDRERPIGQVTAAKVTADEITIRAQVRMDSGLPYVDEAWRQITGELVKGLSIGAQPLKAEPILDNGGKFTGVRYTAWRWLELSAVTLPMNQDSSIEVVRAFDPWGATAFAVRHELRDELAKGCEPDGLDYPTTRARAVAALRLAHRALYRRDSSL